MEPFHEEQRFEWFWAAALWMPAAIVGLGLYNRVASGALLWPAFAVTVAVGVWFSCLKLVTEARDDGLFIWFVWLWPERTIPWDQIRTIETRTYRPIRDFGGWGVRWAARGIVYHARGNQGVRLILASGERVLIGSQDPPALARAIGQRTGLPVGAA